jgi:hypothetical protein
MKSVGFAEPEPKAHDDGSGDQSEADDLQAIAHGL